MGHVIFRDIHKKYNNDAYPYQIKDSISKLETGIYQFIFFQLTSSPMNIDDKHYETEPPSFYATLGLGRQYKQHVCTLSLAIHLVWLILHVKATMNIISVLVNY